MRQATFFGGADTLAGQTAFNWQPGDESAAGGQMRPGWIREVLWRCRREGIVAPSLAKLQALWNEGLAISLAVAACRPGRGFMLVAPVVPIATVRTPRPMLALPAPVKRTDDDLSALIDRHRDIMRWPNGRVRSVALHRSRAAIQRARKKIQAGT